MIRKLLVAAALMVAAAVLEAQGPPPPGGPLPHGKWWRRPEVAENLDLTREQQQKLDEVFNAASTELIDTKAEMRKLEIQLRSELERTQLRRQEIHRIATQLNAARGKLFERELMLLVDMRSVLEDSQWMRLQEEMEERRPPRR